MTHISPKLTATLNKLLDAIQGSPSREPVQLEQFKQQHWQQQPQQLKPTLEAVLRPLEGQLSANARNTYALLFEVALSTLQARGQSPAASQVVMHLPGEILAEALGISRVTMYKHLSKLQQLGLVAYKGHVGAFFGLARKTGTVFAVSLKPGHLAKLRYLDLAHKHRDLEADTQKEGRTAWAFLQGLQSASKRKSVCVTALKTWAVNPGTTQKPVNNDCKPPPSEAVYRLGVLSESYFRQLPDRVNLLAQSLSAAHNDLENVNFWRWLLWRSVEGQQQGLNSVHRLQNALIRVRADIEEWEGLKRPAALLIHRLKECGLWAEFRATD